MKSKGLNEIIKTTQVTQKEKMRVLSDLENNTINISINSAYINGSYAVKNNKVIKPLNNKVIKELSNYEEFKDLIGLVELGLGQCFVTQLLHDKLNKRNMFELEIKAQFAEMNYIILSCNEEIGCYSYNIIPSITPSSSLNIEFLKLIGNVKGFEQILDILNEHGKNTSKATREATKFVHDKLIEYNILSEIDTNINGAMILEEENKNE